MDLHMLGLSLRFPGSNDYSLLGQKTLSPAITMILIIYQAVNRFTRDADDSPDVLNLVGKCYADFKLTPIDWEKMKLMHEVLRVCSVATSFT
jgi:hypothetical protein